MEEAHPSSVSGPGGVSSQAWGKENHISQVEFHSVMCLSSSYFFLDSLYSFICPSPCLPSFLDCDLFPKINVVQAFLWVMDTEQ